MTTESPVPVQPGDLPSPDRIFAIAGGFMVSKTLSVAVEVGLFAALDQAAATAEEIGQRCGIPARSARIMADLLAAYGLLSRDGARYRNAPDAEFFLAGRTPADVRPVIRFWDQVAYPGALEAARAVRTGQGVHPPMGAEQIEAYEDGVATVTRLSGQALAGAYDFGRHQRLLDVGGGIGTMVEPVLAAHPTLRASLLDLPEVVGIARRRVAAEVASRLELVGGDMFADPMPGGHDVILLAHVLHLFPPARNVALLRRLRQVALPQTRLLLADWWRDWEQPAYTVFGPTLFLHIGGGDLYETSEAEQWLADSGWRLVERRPVASPTNLLVAEPSTN